MINNADEMWDLIRGQNPALESGRVRMTAGSLERLVRLVWQQAEQATRRQMMAGQDVVDRLNSMFRRG